MATLDNYAALQGIVARWDRRLRLTQSVLWLPRAFIPGLLIGIGLALVARTRPLWPPPTIALIALAGIAVGVALMLAVIWLWRRSLITGARRFDVQFGLGERVSTALELGTGAIRSNEELRLLQVADAHTRASAVRPGDYLPLRTHSRDWVIVLMLAGLLALFLLLPNPQTETLAEDAQQEAAIDEAADAIREITEEVAADTDLGNEERQALLEQLNQTLDRLEQPNISAEEAFASVSAVQAALEEQARQQQDAAAQNQAALQAAADALHDAADQGGGEQNAQSEGAQTMQGAMEQLTQNLEQFVQNAEQMSEQERQAAADALRNAAQALQQTNPEASEALNQAAEALENSDNQQAQDQLEQAQQQAQQQGEQGQQQEAQAQQAGEQAQQAEQAADQIAQQDDQPQGQPGQPQDGEPQSGPAQQQGQAGEPQQGDGQQSDQPGQNPGESGQPSDQQGGQQQPGGQQGDQPGAVQGSIQAQQGGGSGDDSGESTGQASPAQVAPDQGNNPDGEGEGEYESVNVPRRIGGEGGEEIVLEPDAGDVPVQEGEFAENPEGQVTVPYNQVFGQYQDAANRALEGGYVPLGLRDVVRDYFTALEPSASSR